MKTMKAINEGYTDFADEELSRALRQFDVERIMTSVFEALYLDDDEFIYVMEAILKHRIEVIKNNTENTLQKRENRLSKDRVS